MAISLLCWLVIIPDNVVMSFILIGLTNTMFDIVIHLHSQVYFDVIEGLKMNAESLCKNMEEHGVLVMPESSSRYE